MTRREALLLSLGIAGGGTLGAALTATPGPVEAAPPGCATPTLTLTPTAATAATATQTLTLPAATATATVTRTSTSTPTPVGISGSISATPVPAGSTDTTITWWTSDGSNGFVTVDHGAGPEVFSYGSGFTQASPAVITVNWITPGHVFHFVLYSGVDATGPALATVNVAQGSTLATVTPTAVVAATATPTSTPTVAPASTATPTPTTAPVATATPTTVPSQSQTIVPVAIPLTDPDIPNPYRGCVTWWEWDNTLSGHIVRPPDVVAAAVNYYARYYWRQIEPSRDVYDWSLIDGLVAAATNAGGVAGTRIMACNSACDGFGIRKVPDYLVDLMPLGWTTGCTYVPDWNSAAYLDRVGALNRAMAARYKGNPRLGYVDIFSYGNYGEFHVSDLPYPSPTGAVPGTLATLHRIVNDAHAAWAGGSQLLVIPLQSDVTAVNDAHKYAMETYPDVGWRFDSVGRTDDAGEGTGIPYSEQAPGRSLSKISGGVDRWKIALVAGEPGTGDPANDYEWLRNTQQFHYDLHEPPYGSDPRPNDGDLSRAFKQSGYRFALSSVTLPTTVARGVAFGVTARWANLGVGTFYKDCRVTWQLRQPAGAVVWSGPSIQNMRGFLPTTGADVSEQLTVPTGIPAGTYDLAVSLPTAVGPLRLAIGGRLADGAYRLGSVVVT